MNRRDKTIGRALDELDVPEHAPDFFDRLEVSMNAHDRKSAKGGRRAAGDSARKGRRRFKPVAFVATGLAAAAMLTVAVSLSSPGSFVPDGLAPLVTPQTATAAEVSEKVREAVRSVHAFSGVAVLITKNAPEAAEYELHYEFSATQAGDFRIDGENRQPDGELVSEQIIYNADSGVERSISRSPSFSSAQERTGLAPAAPDPGAAEWMLQRRLASLVRSLEHAEDGTVTEGDRAGRDVWLLQLDIEPNLVGGDHAPDRLEVTVDQATGFPLRVLETRNGVLVSDLSLEDLDFDPALSTESFTLSLPSDLSPSSADFGFRRVALHEAGGVVGYAPLTPTWLPEGFELFEIAVAENSQATGKEGGNPPSRGVVSTVYRRGFERVSISTRLTGAQVQLWSDPLASPEGVIDQPRTVVLESGAFAGASAEVVTEARTVPHLWAFNDDLVLTVSGDLALDDLVRVAESLRPVSD